MTFTSRQDLPSQFSSAWFNRPEPIKQTYEIEFSDQKDLLLTKTMKCSEEEIRDHAKRLAYRYASVIVFEEDGNELVRF